MTKLEGIIKPSDLISSFLQLLSRHRATRLPFAAAFDPDTYWMAEKYAVKDIFVKRMLAAEI